MSKPDPNNRRGHRTCSRILHSAIGRSAAALHAESSLSAAAGEPLRSELRSLRTEQPIPLRHRNSPRVPANIRPPAAPEIPTRWSARMSPTTSSTSKVSAPANSPAIPRTRRSSGCLESLRLDPPDVECPSEAAEFRSFLDFAAAEPAVVPLHPVGAAGIDERAGVDHQSAGRDSSIPDGGNGRSPAPPPCGK